MIKITLFCLLFILNISCSRKEYPKGSLDNPLLFTLAPSENATNSLNNAKGIQEYMEKSLSQKMLGKNSGFYVSISVPSSYIAALEAYGSKRNDFGVISTLNYLIAVERKKLPVKIVMMGTGLRVQNDSYFSQIIVRSDSKINTLQDLIGKSFAYTDPASTSGHLVPSSLLKKNNIKLGNTFFAARHDAVATMVYQGKVDAGATYHIPEVKGVVKDARSRILTQFPDAISKLKILKISDPIPNSPWVIRSNIYDNQNEQSKLENAIVETLTDYIRTKEGREVFSALNNIQNFKRVTDLEYRQKLKVFDLATLKDIH